MEASDLHELYVNANASPREALVMRETQITIPELAMIAGTRAAAGAGLGLLLAGHLSEEQRRAVGWTLLLVGIASTIPLAFEVLGSPHRNGIAHTSAQPSLPELSRPGGVDG
jgi:uncharacterized membrane protein YfcA